MVDMKHLIEKGSKRCIIAKERNILKMTKPNCIGKNNQCKNQLRRQMCKELWKEALRIAKQDGLNKALQFLNKQMTEIEEWF